MTCIASRTEAVPGKEMRGCSGRLSVDEVTARLKLVGMRSGGREMRCSRSMASVRIKGALSNEVIAIRWMPEANKGRMLRRGASAGST